MATEIELKFLVVGDAWRELAESEEVRQGYIPAVKDGVIRVRMVGNRGTLTIKGIMVKGSRLKFEYEIPERDANGLLANYCQQPIIEKTRYKIPYQGFIWEVDQFHGVNEGMIVAEIELADIDKQFAKPDWIGDEVTEDPRYFNSNLLANPFTRW
jgi:CYTH domain-containing protein